MYSPVICIDGRNITSPRACFVGTTAYKKKKNQLNVDLKRLTTCVLFVGIGVSAKVRGRGGERPEVFVVVRVQQ